MEHTEQRAAGSPTVPNEYGSNSPMVKKLAVIALVVIVGIGGFIGGMQYQKKHGSTSATLSSARGSMQTDGRGFGGRSMNGAVGSVTAISSSSITVNDERTGTSKTYGITSSTAITDDGSAATYSSISVGTRVFVLTVSSTSTTATRIMVNPTMGGGFGGGQDAAGGSSSTSETQ